MADIIQHKLLVIEEGHIASMATNPIFLKEFPFLASINSVKKARGGGCRTCGGSNNDRSAVFTAVKQAIAGMSSSRKLLMKEMMHTKQIRLIYVNASRKTIHHTF